MSRNIQAKARELVIKKHVYQYMIKQLKMKDDIKIISEALLRN